MREYISREGPQTPLSSNYPEGNRRVSKADLHVSCITSSPFMPLSCDRPHKECLEAALYHIYYFVRAAVSAK